MMDASGRRAPAAFLVTDIEGSTRLWEQHPDAMARAHARHDQILLAAIAASDGEAYRSIGDSVQAAFPDVRHAISAAIDAQLALHAIDWEIAGGLRVRMAIHAASAERTVTGDYRSPELGRLRAALALAHGGQVLMTGDAADALAGSLPAGVMLVDHGRWQSPGAGPSVAITQLTHELLQSAFPPLRGYPARGSIMQLRESRFVGRRPELEQLHSLLSQSAVRVITITGPGGIGKTRLVQQLARELQETDHAAIWFVDLVRTSEPAQVLSEIAATVQIPEMGFAGPYEALIAGLRDRELLLVLDNFEHVQPAAGDIARLLADLPKVRVIVTSRAPLRIQGEWQVPLGPLSLPAPVASHWEELDASESIQLFIDRASAAVPGFALDRQNASSLVGIVRKLEGLPLAIELAAPRMRVLTIGELDARLDDRLGTLSAENPDRPGRHRAIRASIGWSYELLPVESRRLFRLLGVLPGGFTLDTLEGLFGEQFDVLREVELLIQESLIHQGGFQRDPARFSLLESVRQFAVEQLAQAAELDAAREHHARYFAGRVLARHRDQRSIDASAAGRYLPMLDDLRQAIGWLTLHDPDEGLALGEGTWRLWFVAGGQLSDADRWLGALLDATGDRCTIQRVRALYGRAIVRHYMNDMQAAEAYDRESLALARTLGDERGIGDACNHMAGVLWIAQGDNLESRQLLEDAMVAYERIADRHGMAETLLNRAAFAMIDGRYDDTLADGLRVLAYCEAEGKDVLASNTIQGVAEAAQRLGDTRQAIALVMRAFELSRSLEYDIFTGANVQLAAGLLLDADRPEDALRLASFVRSFAEERTLSGDVVDPFGHAEDHHTRMMASLDEAARTRAIGAGERLGPEDAVEQALELLRSLDRAS